MVRFHPGSVIGVRKQGSGDSSECCLLTPVSCPLFNGLLVQWDDSCFARRQSGFDSPAVHSKRLMPERASEKRGVRLKSNSVHVTQEAAAPRNRIGAVSVHSQSFTRLSLSTGTSRRRIPAASAQTEGSRIWLAGLLC